MWGELWGPGGALITGDLWVVSEERGEMGRGRKGKGSGGTGRG